MAPLRVEHLRLQAGGQCLLADLSLTFPAGSCWAILGRNGAGKTSLLRALSGLHVATHGQVWLAERPIAQWPARERAQRLGLLPQHPDMARDVRVLEYLALGDFLRSPMPAARAELLLQQFELTKLIERRLHQLSGGERQRLALATLAAQAPAVMLLDEPLNHLDLPHQLRTLHWLQQRAGLGDLVLLTLHDVNWARRYCSHALLLDGAGGWAAGTVSEMLTPERLSQLLGHPLHAAQGDEGWLIPAAT